MNILIVGSGGREHALAWKAAQSTLVTKIFVAPGNGGTASEAKIENVNIAATDIAALMDFAQTQAIDLTIVGPEAPLAAGIVDQFSAQGLACFGPTQAAAQLESSKAFSKDFMQRHQIPTAAYQSFTETDAAKNYIEQHAMPLVIKADGLAAGKGVVIAQDQQEAIAAVESMLAGNAFGEAGHRVVIEEFLQGEEASFIVITDGTTILPLATSQDHKARDEGDQGPNTGGMGAYSPAPVITAEIEQHIMDQIIQPTIDGMAQDGHPYCGFLYAGLMIDQQGNAKVLEYNCRLGDPETQPIMMRLQSDLIALCLATVEHSLAKQSLQWDPRPALGVVLCAGGYPADYDKGHIISGIKENHAAIPQKVFHAGTVLSHNQLRTNGGRVLCVTSLGDTITQAQHNAYALANTISWDDMYYRKDIGHKAIARE